ncbi:cellulase family glycosylhydrolase (plasmid) [Deinococcus taeanensis]|uniref:cellulase family glycosylhydrolase n=1 Tax=Deinococcus taeanensis TaxID=2737050 RepID=UPI001CDC590C|nr:cellulase family glycosylhydrolase [Deinococcus taeanensis]UBV44457.1 cellulase family glycosylhydrolase [Deinococcus taeanensis]
MLGTLVLGGAALADGFVTRSSAQPWTLEIDGIPCVPYGLNRFAVMKPGNNREDWSTEQYMRHAATRGVNTIRLFVPEPEFESTRGAYDPEQVRRLDQTIELAGTYTVKLIVCLFDHWVFRHVLDTSAYGAKSGGPLTTGKAFYTSSVARSAQARRIAFLVSRYQDSLAILAWEPINELNGVCADYPGQREEALDWLHFAVATIKKSDQRHLITQSLTGDVRWEELWSDPTIDLVQLHTYREVRNPDRAAAVARNAIRWAQETFQKPALVGEYAPTGRGRPGNPRGFRDRRHAGLVRHWRKQPAVDTQER